MTLVAVQTELERTPLDELAARINAEAQAIRTSLSQSVQHAMTAGDLLIKAREMVPYGQWETWLARNTTVSAEWARLWMRCYRHRNLILREQPESVKAAERLLVRKNVRDVRVDPVIRAEAKRLRSEGKTLVEVAAELGVHRSNVQRWVNPRAEERYRAKRRQNSKRGRSALLAQERKRLAQKLGGDLSEAYSHIRLALDVLERAAGDSSGEKRKAIRAAMHSLYRAEDTVSNSIKNEVAA